MKSGSSKEGNCANRIESGRATPNQGWMLQGTRLTQHAERVDVQLYGDLSSVECLWRHESDGADAVAGAVGAVVQHGGQTKVGQQGTVPAFSRI